MSTFRDLLKRVTCALLVASHLGACTTLNGGAASESALEAGPFDAERAVVTPREQVAFWQTVYAVIWIAAVAYSFGHVHPQVVAQKPPHWIWFK